MQRIRQMHSSFRNSALSELSGQHPLFPELTTDYTDLQPTGQATPGLGASILIVIGSLVLAGWSVTLTTGNNFTYERPPIIQAIVAPAAHPEAEAQPNLPSPQTIVASGSMGIFHWEEDCPLTSARSLKGNTHRHVSRPEDARLTRREAGLRGLRSCSYCSEIEYWLARRS